VALAKFLVNFAKRKVIVGAAQNNKEEGARVKKLVTCGTRGSIGRRQSLPFIARGAYCSAPEP